MHKNKAEISLYLFCIWVNFTCFTGIHLLRHEVLLQDPNAAQLVLSNLSSRNVKKSDTDYFIRHIIYIWSVWWRWTQNPEIQHDARLACRTSVMLLKILTCQIIKSINCIGADMKNKNSSFTRTRVVLNFIHFFVDRNIFWKMHVTKKFLAIIDHTVKNKGATEEPFI